VYALAHVDTWNCLFFYFPIVNASCLGGEVDTYLI
jgi:hypothetical protein